MKARIASSGVSKVGMPFETNARLAASAVPSPSQLVNTGRRRRWRQIRDQWQAGDGLEGQDTLDRAMLRIDRHHRAVEMAAEQVLCQHKLFSYGPVRRANQIDQLNLEKLMQNQRVRALSP